MSYKIFAVPILDGALIEQEMNVFLKTHRVLGVQKSLVEQDGSTYWAFCVDYREGDGRGEADRSNGGRRKERRDPREWLPPEASQQYETLRQKRMELARAGGLPAYAVFSNQQLEEMVTRRVRTLEGLKGLSSMTPAQLEKYAGVFLTVLESLFQDVRDETRGESVSKNPGVGESAAGAVESPAGQA